MSRNMSRNIISKIDLNCEKQIILSMIPNEEKEG